ncbi:MAG: hypothetical protein VX699_00075, partial [Myxococcota bacterium]|nr:hypothetical protein [Myxococcota bacterium]
MTTSVAQEAVAACNANNLGTLDCPCLGGSQCVFGLFCETGVCRSPLLCEGPGTMNCACDEDNVCAATLECVSGICKSCGLDIRGCSCSANSDCGSGNMECIENSCDCAGGYRGPSCQFSNKTTCNGNGVVSAAGSCDCSGNWDGTSCDECAEGYAGAKCQFSDSTTCYNRGQAQDNGTCTCDGGWIGERCTDCSEGVFGVACASECPGGAANPCNGRGTCDDGVSGQGTCICDTGWKAPSCNNCASGFIKMSPPGGDPLCCEAGSLNCSCRSGGGDACDAGSMCVNNLCVEPICDLGEEGCACRPTSGGVRACDTRINEGLEEPMMCEAGICRTRSCKPGEVGCVCVGGDDQTTGICAFGTCQDGYCGGLVARNDWDISGGFDEECRTISGNSPVADTCDWGFRCDRKPGQSGNEVGVCLPCDPGTQSCQCRVPASDEESECEAGLTCIPDGLGGRCEYSEWAAGLPCFAYCGASAVGVATDPDGNSLNCEGGVVPACVYDPANQCAYGGCYEQDEVDNEDWRTCEVDPDCPDFQRCLYEPSLRKKICASTCGPSMPWACDEGAECLNGVCRQECTVDNEIHCENSNEDCRPVKSSNANNKLGHCFAQNPVTYRAYGSQGIATFAVTSDEDRGDLGCKMANGQYEVGAEGDCANKVRGDECGSNTPVSTCEYKTPREILSTSFAEVYNSNPPRFRARFRVKNTGPWKQTFAITKSRETLASSSGAMITRTIPSPSVSASAGAACIPGSLGCVAEKGQCRPWSDPTYIDGGENCTNDSECNLGIDKGLVCGEESGLCERPAGQGCTSDNQCGSKAGAKCVDEVCRRVLNAQLNTETMRCDLGESQMSLGDAKSTSQKAGVLLPFLGVRLNEEDAEYHAVHEVEIEPGESGVVWLEFERDLACANAGSNECAWKGEVDISTGGGTSKKLSFRYDGGKQSVWTGYTVTFGSFPRSADWDKQPSASDIQFDQSGGNALVEAYLDFDNASDKTKARIEQLFQDLGSARKDSWKKGEVCKAACSGSSGICRPSPQGLECIGMSGQEMPSGPLEAPFTAYLDFSGATNQKSHVLTSETLHFPGNPAINLSRGYGSQHQALNDFKLVSVVDGRYIPGDSNEPDTCKTGYEKHTTPWLLAVSGDSSCPGADCSAREFNECRGTQYPFVGEQSKNKNFSVANPVADGSRIKRTIDLIKGYVLNNQDLVAFFRETVEYLGESELENSMSYGFMVLKDMAEGVDTRDVVSFEDQDKTVPPSPVDVYNDRDWCRPAFDLLEEVNPDLDTEGLTTRLKNGSGGPQLGKIKKIANTLMYGVAEPETDPIYMDLICVGESSGNADCDDDQVMGDPCGSSTPKKKCGYDSTGDEWIVHYLCEETGLFDDRCPVESKVTYFLTRKGWSAGGTKHGQLNHACETSAPADANWQAKVDSYIDSQFIELGLRSNPDCKSHNDVSKAGYDPESSGYLQGSNCGVSTAVDISIEIEKGNGASGRAETS